MSEIQKVRKALFVSFAEISQCRQVIEFVGSLSEEFEKLQVLAFGVIPDAFLKLSNVEYIQLDCLPHSDKQGWDDLWRDMGLEKAVKGLPNPEVDILRQKFNNVFFRFAALMTINGGHGVIYWDGDDAQRLAQCAKLMSGGSIITRALTLKEHYPPVDLNETSRAIFRKAKCNSLNSETVVIISFSPVARDCRVLRQIQFISEKFRRVVVLGFGDKPDFAHIKEEITWISLGENKRSFIDRGVSRLAGGWLSCVMHVGKYKMLSEYYANNHALQASLIVRHFRMKLLVCNDVDTLPLGMLVSEKSNKFTKVVFDLHEWATEQYMGAGGNSERLKQIWLILRHCADIPNFTTTVADSFLDIFPKDYGLKNIYLVRNVPDKIELPQRRVPDGKIHIIHHGGCSPGRDPERMIETMTHLEERFVLHLMLVADECNEYYKSLQKLAAEKAPGRIHFEEPVPVNMIVKEIAGNYDLGMYILPPDTPNHLHALPNKFFDFIAAGLAVAIGPSLNMAKYVHEYGIGFVADDFDSSTMAKMLNNLTLDDIDEARLHSMKLREEINAEKEVGGFAEMCRRLVDSGNV